MSINNSNGVPVTDNNVPVNTDENVRISNKSVAEVEEAIREAKVTREKNGLDNETSTIKDARLATEEKALADAKEFDASNPAPSVKHLKEAEVKAKAKTANEAGQ